MRNFILFCFVLIGLLSANAQSTLSTEMTMYRDACLKLNEGIVNNFDKDILLDAADMFDKVEITELDNYFPSDDETVINESQPSIYYIAEFADSLASVGGLVSIDNISTLRKGIEDAPLLVLHKGVKAHSYISYISTAHDNCQMMVIGEPGANVRLTITDFLTDETYSSIQEADGMVSYVTWDFPAEETMFVFTIENLSDNDISVVIAEN